MSVRFAIPKGSLENSTFRLLERSWTHVRRKDRTYRVYLDDPQIIVKMLRPQEIPTLVAEGLYDVGITGNDWVSEARADVDELLDLEYGRVRLVTAFPNSRYSGLDAMIADYARKKKTLRISTEYLTTTARFVKSCPAYKKKFGAREPLIITPWLRTGTNNAVQIHLSFGATEAKPPEDVDAILDVTETGTTLAQNKLKIGDDVLVSTAHLIANKRAVRDIKKREKIFDILTMLRGAVYGKKYLHIYLNVEEKNLDKLLKVMPSLKRPTISPLSEPGWFGLNTIIKKTEYHSLVPKLRRLAQGLVVHEPRQILELEEINRAETHPTYRIPKKTSRRTSRAKKRR